LPWMARLDSGSCLPERLRPSKMANVAGSGPYGKCLVEW
jgi:hypothetical protein